MAIAVRRLLVSTLLTLFVVPCVYELLACFERDRRAVGRHMRIEDEYGRLKRHKV